MSAIAFVYGEEDWMAVYADSLLLTSNSNLRAEVVVRFLVGRAIERLNTFTVNQAWLDEHGFPDRFSDIPKDKIQEYEIP